MATRPLTLVERLHSFVKRWSDYQSTEMAGAQSFLHGLLECYDALDYQPGTLFEQHPLRIIEPRQQSDMFDAATPPKVSTERMDMYLPKICVWEMKGPEEELKKHTAQVLRYWSHCSPPPRYMVLCNFHEFWIYDTDREGGQLEPIHALKLADLPQNPEALNFLRGEETHFAKHSEKITKAAAAYIGKAVRELILTADNPERDRPRITKFALECVFAMFAEDTGLVPGKLFELAMKKAQASGDLSPVYTLFDDFGREHDYDRSNPIAPYINGPLFDTHHPKLPVNKTILGHIYTAAEGFNWTFVRPEVFGSIFEQAFLPHQRHELGAHFTAEDDIMKVVGPTVVRPWRERIAAAKTHKDCEALIERMQHYHVLDPACGSGNFLYIVYREMKLLEAALRNRHQELYKHKVSKRKADMLPPPPGPYFTLQQLHGIDKDELAVQLSRVVLWIGQHLASREGDTGEASLPLRDLSENIVKADALFTDWFRPEDDGISELAIVGNPPFMGRHKMRQEMGDEYVDKVQQAYPKNKNADFVSYWYTQALKFLHAGERAGFVSTNSIGQNENREVSIDAIIDLGGSLVNAWKTYPWQGEAAVHVSIVNWCMFDSPEIKYLDGEKVLLITPRLTSDVDLSIARKIAHNSNISFKGVEPGNKKFIIESPETLSKLKQDENSEEIIKPLLIGRDINRTIDQLPTRHIIDFTGYELKEARKFSACFDYIQEYVLPKRVSKFDRKLKFHKENWWLFHRPRPAMRKAITDLNSFLVTPRTSPFVLFAFTQQDVLVDNAAVVIALDSYYHYGLLQSAVHEYWAWARGSTLEERLRYTNTTIFETFPFPMLDCKDPIALGRAAVPGRQSSSASVPACADDECASTGACTTDSGTTARRGRRHPESTGRAARSTQDNEPMADTAVHPTGENVDPGGIGRAPHRPEDGLVQSTAPTQDGEPKAGRDARPTQGCDDLLANYNPREVPDTPEARRVSAVAEELYTKRQAACKALNLGLTKLYNYIKNKRAKADPQGEGFDVVSNLNEADRQRILELRELHEQLNNSVCACYGWPEDTWRDENEVLKRLLALNLALCG